MTESRNQAAFDAASRRVEATVASVAGRVTETLGTLATSSMRTADRELLNRTQFELRRNAQAFHRSVVEKLGERVASEFAPREAEGARRRATDDWQTLALVDDAEMDERMHADRIGQSISHACDGELRELAGYLASLLPNGRGNIDRHPWHAEVLGSVVYRSIVSVSGDGELRRLLAREFGRALEKAMPTCYADIVRDLQALGLRPAVLTARSVDSLGGGAHSGDSSPGSTSGHSAAPEVPSSRLSTLDGLTTPGSGPRAGRAGNGSPTDDPSEAGGRSTSDTGSGGAPADAALMALLRRLTAVTSGLGELGAAPLDGPITLSRPAFSASAFSATAMGGRGSATGLMAPNVIRAHRDELVQASAGQLDHMIIDVVGSLFDQILSDPRVPPQMARQIARLQLPVLRVALSDAGFFSSRRHPVRRFVNRMASLACAFDDFDTGPGLHFLDRVRQLVQEIVDGDFDRIDLYAAKLDELERFIAEQTSRQAAQSGTAVALEKKETELRLQQRCRLHLQASLAKLPMPPWLRDFLEQVWSQALVLSASAVDAPDRAQRFRVAGRDLVLSVQPKGSPAMRKKFIMQLPPLMKALNEGMALVGWPDAAKQGFLAQLLPSHAASLKLAPLSELDHNLLSKQLEAIFALAADAADTSPSAPIETIDAAVEPRFSPEEAKAIGLVQESAVDWTGTVDIDLAVERPDDEVATTTVSPGLDISLGTGLDIVVGERSSEPAELAEPTAGPGLMAHVKLGFAYQMHLQGEWQKVRLTHVSAGRGFFVFSRGKNHQETISTTSRMLARMCETGRLRAFESAYLMERATQRARRQLAALKTPARV